MYGGARFLLGLLVGGAMTASIYNDDFRKSAKKVIASLGKDIQDQLIPASKTQAKDESHED